MKKISFIAVIFVGLVFASCHKEEIFPNSNGGTSKNAVRSSSGSTVVGGSDVNVDITDPTSSGSNGGDNRTAKN